MISRLTLSAVLFGSLVSVVLSVVLSVEPAASAAPTQVVQLERVVVSAKRS